MSGSGSASALSDRRRTATDAARPGIERRGLIKRRPDPSDTRATDACLTPAGLTLVREAQATHLADVQAAFFDRLTDAEVRTLGQVFVRLSGEPLGATASRR